MKKFAGIAVYHLLSNNANPVNDIIGPITIQAVLIISTIGGIFE